MSEKEFNESLERAVALDTVDRAARKGLWSAYIDGKLYQSIKHKVGWTLKNQVSNSIRNYSNVASVLKTHFEDLCFEEHPDWFEKLPHTLNRRWVKSKHYSDVADFIGVRMDNWMNAHVTFDCSGSGDDIKEKVLKIVAEYIQKTDKCMIELEEDYEDGNEDDVARYHYWDGAHDIAIAIEREIKDL